MGKVNASTFARATRLSVCSSLPRIALNAMASPCSRTRVRGRAYRTNLLLFRASCALYCTLRNNRRDRAPRENRSCASRHSAVRYPPATIRESRSRDFIMLREMVGVACRRTRFERALNGGSMVLLGPFSFSAVSTVQDVL